MPRQLGKLKTAEATIAERDEHIKDLESLVRALKIKELETMVVYRGEQINFASHKLKEAKISFAKGMEKEL